MSSVASLPSQRRAANLCVRRGYRRLSQFDRLVRSPFDLLLHDSTFFFPPPFPLQCRVAPGYPAAFSVPSLFLSLSVTFFDIAGIDAEDLLHPFHVILLAGLSCPGHCGGFLGRHARVGAHVSSCSAATAPRSGIAARARGGRQPTRPPPSIHTPLARVSPTSPRSRARSITFGVSC